ncbi:neurensin-1-like isoform X2 [Sipha flava]|nr:neurensin-1-like isoform X2 [Sipha flava]XP_025419733.1 neurensin-1-like isoform X2 [Sipha flava]
MISDNDVSESVSSSGSGCPSPVSASKTRRTTEATTAKGILVHNKKSTNTNRVSFVTQNPSSLLSPSFPSAKRFKKKQLPLPQQSDSDDHIPYYFQTGRQLTGFGVKSYLHEFYDDPEDPLPFQDEDDDFKYCVEPEIRWRRHCSGVYTVLGFAIITLGAVAMAVGHLVPAKDPMINRSANVMMIDRRAVTFNENLALCRFVGSMLFAVGVVFTVVRFWMSVIRSGRGIGDGGSGGQAMFKKKKLDVDEERPSVEQCQQRRPAQTSVRIPVTGSVENVQPDPRAINLKFGDTSS